MNLSDEKQCERAYIGENPENSVHKSNKRERLGLIPLIIGCALMLFCVFVIITILFHSQKNYKDSYKDIIISSVIPFYETKTATENKTENKSSENKVTPKKTENPTDESDKKTTPKSAAGIELLNETSYTPDLSELLNSERSVPKLDVIYKEYGFEEPVVLIYHTHGTECYSNGESDSYRSADTAENVVAVGSVITDELEKNDIGVIHLTQMFDYEDFNSAYDRSTNAVRQIIEKYPSLKYILDIHRDAVEKDGEYIKTSFDGMCRLMFVCGTDEGGSGHGLWRENLTTALHLQSLLLEKNSNIIRPINLKKASFYQDTSPGALIVEFGNCGDTLEEAKKSAVVFSEILSEYIKE